MLLIDMDKPDTNAQKNTLDHPLITTISYVGNLVEEELDKNLNDVGLSVTQLSALFHIYEHDEAISLSDLAKNKGCVKSNVTQLIDRMENDGLVERNRSKKDRRKVWAVITPKGKQAYLEGKKILESTENKFMSRLSEQQRKKLTYLLQLISEG